MAAPPLFLLIRSHSFPTVPRCANSRSPVAAGVQTLFAINTIEQPDNSWGERAPVAPVRLSQ